MKTRETSILPQHISLICHIPRRNFTHVFYPFFLPFLHAGICSCSHGVCNTLHFSSRSCKYNRLKSDPCKEPLMTFALSCSKKGAWLLKNHCKTCCLLYLKLLLLSCINVTESLLRTNQLLCWKPLCFHCENHCVVL